MRWHVIHKTVHVRTRGYAAVALGQKRSHKASSNRNYALYTASVLVGGVAVTYAAVPLYRAFTKDRLVPVESSRRIRVTFSANVSDALPWSFHPSQRQVEVLPGETALAFYKAKNRGPDDIIGMATYNVTPAQVAPYFSKIQCFCFEEQRLNAGEEVDMPVFFFLDPEFAEDPLMKRIDTVTLCYTFFKAKYDDQSRPVVQKPGE